MTQHFPTQLQVFQNLYRTFSSDLRKPCCKLAKACLQIKILILFVRKSVITP